jgi:hypothetical protein
MSRACPPRCASTRRCSVSLSCTPDRTKASCTSNGPGRRFRTAALDRPYGRGANFQLEVTDIAAVRDRVASLGYELLVDLEDRWYRTGHVESGQRQLVVSDPDGYLWRPFQHLGQRPTAG